MRGVCKIACLLWLSGSPNLVHAQFTFTTNNGTITITGYTGPSTAVVIPSTINGYPVTTIGGGTFSEYVGNSSPTSVTIPDSVTTIEGGVFDESLNLTNVSIGSGATNITGGTFADCYCPLTAISVSPGNSTYSSVNGVLFDKNQSTLIAYPEGLYGTYTISNGVTSIGDYAFDLCWNVLSHQGLNSITIPSSVTSIGNDAFLGCYGLTNVTMSTNVNSIGASAFEDCIGVSSLIIPNGVTSILSSAFENTGLTSVMIPYGVTNIGTRAFAVCGSLTNVYFTGNTPIPTNDSSVFAGVAGGSKATAYYLPGTTGWGRIFDGIPTALWLPAVQINDGSFGIVSNQFGFNINWASGETVLVEASTNLSNPVWIPVGTNTLTSGPSYFSDSAWTNYPARFYRLSSQ